MTLSYFPKRTPTHYLAKMSLKLHENEENWAGNARRPCHMGGEPPRSSLECQDWLAYARKGLASGQPADIRKGETEPRQQFRKRQRASRGSPPSSAAGFAVRCRRIPGQVSPDCRSNAPDFAREVRGSDSRSEYLNTDRMEVARNAFAAEAPCCNSVDTPHERIRGSNNILAIPQSYCMDGRLITRCENNVTSATKRTAVTFLGTPGLRDALCDLRR